MLSLNKQILEIEEKYNLQYSKKEKEFIGFLEVDEDDFYHVKINIGAFPLFFPLVYETGERIPVNIDRHVYDNGVCCLTTRAKEQILLKKRIKTLDDFIKLIVVPYFQNNSFYEINNKYINGEYAHGVEGIFEAYHEIMNISELNLLLEILNWRISGKKFDRNKRCFCNSGKKFKRCHASNYSNLFLIDEKTIINDIMNLHKFFVNSLKL